ncbi:MAG: hypothetical protein COU29_00165 [Candidatus Magasanikbacteria bacterium CG10_big_fil_rev_8_21_14_0_10_36_32]|uniref:DUF559 domain-containing protein n=1 Tax=Candidatus Magasanikbacteria bacterium CG10_big_fil_rev_8_21_14_0_10_36_32 TaxID=1974646 RepID=A0A2M6W7N5_9BACT|nr:MAG: hypothetical protein COU29_00165 [Candidatus Magasanikbacteria bacterium CG10_big_fil_rev_8_21_14_0_10_36_32]
MYRVTQQVTNLYNALINRGIKCKLEDDSDGHKTVDISIPASKINIEVDGLQHYIDPEQIKADFKRSYWSIENDDYDTFHVSNIVIDNHLEQVADALAIVARSHYNAIKEEEKEENDSVGIWNWIKNLFEK